MPSSNTVQISSLLTVKGKVDIATSIIEGWAESNTYIGIGHVSPWPGGIENSTTYGTIPIPNNSTDSENFVYDNLVALKRITGADMALVVPRVDWQTGVVYTPYANNTETFSTENDVLLSGTVNATVGSNTLIGSSATHFSTDFSVGNLVKFVNPTTNYVTIKEIVSIANDKNLTVNSSFNDAASNSPYYLYNSTFPEYSNSFYVRNSYDQVYKCISNNMDSPSTAMPQINLGGNLPSNPYIITSPDNYKWKYLYTISSGQKQKFFDSDFMPVSNDSTVTASAVDGRIDYINIIDGGQKYNGNVACTSAKILTVSGDGTGAEFRAVVDSNGTILDTVFVNGGSGYTYATISIDGGSLFGLGANLIPVISPAGGNGSNSYYELGATTVYISSELQGTEGGIIPVGSDGTTTPFLYNQICIIKDPLEIGGNVASGLAYDMTTSVFTAPPPAGSSFTMNEVVYQGFSVPTSTFNGTVVYWNNTDNVIHLNNLRGKFKTYSGISGSLSNITVTAFSLGVPDIAPYTGKILYIQNRSQIARSSDQTDQIRIILEL
jgi:hypothetical protein